ncbi:MAG: hypothetical protein QOC83_6048, partial [Pseudonocardiales bacterium]|nr:hypothetical protein [Pseudonocardiales bacterium]
MVPRAPRALTCSEPRPPPAEGAKIVVSDVHEKPNTGGFEADATLTTAETIEKAGGRAVYINCDVTKSDEVANLVAETVKAFGRLDVMI